MCSVWSYDWWVEPDIVLAVSSCKKQNGCGVNFWTIMRSPNNLERWLLVSNIAHIPVVMVNSRVRWTDVLYCGQDLVHCGGCVLEGGQDQ